MTLTRAVVRAGGQAGRCSRSDKPDPAVGLHGCLRPRPPEALQEIPRCLLRVAERQVMAEAAGLASKRQQGKASSPGLHGRYLVARQAVPPEQHACH